MSRQVVILAGGLGTRLRPLTVKVPKPLVEVAGRPFLEWQLRECKRQGFTDIVLLIAYLGEQIEAAFGDGRDLGLRIRYSREPEPLGTGGALKNAQPLLDDEFFVLNGDSFLQAPMQEMLRAFTARSAEIDALVSAYDLRQAVPVIENLRVSGEERGQQVVDYRKDAGPAQGFTHVDSGVYILKKEILSGAAENARFQLESLWPELIRQGRLGAFTVKERFYDIGTPERLKEFEEKVRDYFPHSL